MDPHDLKPENLRYIVFCIDSKYKDHDGKVFVSYDAAKAFVNLLLKEKFITRAVIGTILLNPTAQEMNITMIETIGFQGDKKDINKISLFS